jgi:hypothetical protein
MIETFFAIFVFCACIALAESYYEHDWPRDTGKFTIISGILFLLSLSAFSQNTRWDMPGGTLTTLVVVLCLTPVAMLPYQLYKFVYKFAAFRPYEVVIGVNFATLCEDLALEWIEEKPRDSRTFTAITPFLFDRSDRRSNERRYMVGMFFNVEVSCARVPWHPGLGSILGGCPRVSLYPHNDGLRIGVQVDPKWWSQHKSEASSEIRNLPVERDGTIVLGFLPSGYIPEHVRREIPEHVRREGKQFVDKFSRRHRRWKAKLSKLGWSIDESHIGRIQHRYLIVTCNVI